MPKDPKGAKQGPRRGAAADASDEIAGAIASLLTLTEWVERRRSQLVRDVGLSPLQAMLLEEIASEDFMPSLFARSREHSAPAVSRALRVLGEKGWVRSAISADDARQRDYSLTAAGRRVFQRLQSRRREAIDAVWRDLPKAEVLRFTRFAADLAERFERYAGDATVGSRR